jgi:hypothetical protein
MASKFVLTAKEKKLLDLAHRIAHGHFWTSDASQVVEAVNKDLEELNDRFVNFKGWSERARLAYYVATICGEAAKFEADSNDYMWKKKVRKLQRKVRKLKDRPIVQLYGGV